MTMHQATTAFLRHMVAENFRDALVCLSELDASTRAQVERAARERVGLGTMQRWVAFLERQAVTGQPFAAGNRGPLAVGVVAAPMSTRGKK